jgi:hypothetical protein
MGVLHRCHECYSGRAMPTTDPRLTIAETDEVAAAMDAAASLSGARGWFDGRAGLEEQPRMLPAAPAAAEKRAEVAGHDPR